MDPVAEPADVHARAQPNVLERVEGLDRLLVVGDILLLFRTRLPARIRRARGAGGGLLDGFIGRRFNGGLGAGCHDGRSNPSGPICDDNAAVDRNSIS